MSKINPDHTLHIQRCCVRGIFVKCTELQRTFYKNPPDAAPLDVESVVWIDFAHGSTNGPCSQDTFSILKHVVSFKRPIAKHDALSMCTLHGLIESRY
jgi:hypothetical protein